MAKRITTLFIEDTAIRFLVARGKHAEKWASVPLEPGLVEHGLVQDQAVLAAKLKETFRWAKLSERVRLGLSEPGSLYRIINLPKLPDAILPEAIKREAERVLPLSQDEIYLAQQIISSTKDEIQLFLTAFSRNAVDTLVGTLQMAGIKPASLDLVPLALCRITEQPTAIIISLRSSNFEIAVMVDRIPQVIRSLSMPGEAESLVDKLPTIAEELERTVAFYNSSHTDKPLDDAVPVFVDGDLVQVPDSWPSLVGTLGSTVIPFPTVMQTEEEFEASEFNVNIGLALMDNLEEGTSSIIGFNALPAAYLPPKPRLSTILIPVVAGIGVLILFYVGIQTRTVGANLEQATTELHLKQQQTAKLNEDIVSLKEQVKEAESQIQPLQDQIDATKADVITFDNLANVLNENRQQTDEATAKIVELVPDSMSLESISYSTTISVAGTASDETVIFTYARDIIDSGMFSSLLIQTITYNDDEEIYSFLILTVPK